MAITRRTFLIVGGAAAASLVLPGRRRLALPGRFALAVAGACDFCGTPYPAAGALAGAIGRPHRICSACIDLTLETLGDEMRWEPAARALAGAAAYAEIERQVRDGIATGVFDRDPAALSAAARALRERLLHEFGRTTPPAASLGCSFCDARQHDVWRLIAGAGAFICDVCAADAAALVVASGRVG
ncbi:MAG: hypothetical protein D6689_06205 [Deltaproteobacteria bacterium]|nr:MAG: hypothetical protein D6689_06205 [Deltaproteobacteria bacterium]